MCCSACFPVAVMAPLVQFILEHYTKKHSSYFEDPCKPNEIRVGGGGKSRDLCNKASRFLKDGSELGVVISAMGGYVTKAVTIVELLKKKVPEVQQETIIKYVRVEDVWEPDEEGLDRIKVTRKIPFISIHLVEPPKKIADSEDILPCIDLKEDESEGRGKQPSLSGNNWAKSVQGVWPESMGMTSCHDVSQESGLVDKLMLKVNESEVGEVKKKRRKRQRKGENGDKAERKPSEKGHGKGQDVWQ